MKRFTIYVGLLMLATIIGGCKKPEDASKPADTEKSATTSQPQPTATAQHTTMKPVTPSVTDEQKATQPTEKTSEVAKPVAGTSAAKGEAKTPSNPVESKDKQ